MKPASSEFERDRATLPLAYGFWCLLLFGMHRFYLQRRVTGALMLVLGGCSLFLGVIQAGSHGFLGSLPGRWWPLAFWGLPGSWALIDLLLIPGMIRKYNDGLIGQAS